MGIINLLIRYNLYFSNFLRPIDFGYREDDLFFLIKSLETNTRINNLNFDYLTITHEVMEQLHQTLLINNNIVSIVMTEGGVLFNCFNVLINIINDCRHLKCLIISNVRNQEEFDKIFIAVANSNLNHFKCYNYQEHLTKEYINHRRSIIKNLCLSHISHLTDNDLADILSIIDPDVIENIHLHWSNAGQKCCDQLVKILKNSKSIKHIDVYGTSMSDDKLIQLTRALTQNISLKTFIGGFNSTTKRTLSIIKEILENVTTLEIYDLNDPYDDPYSKKLNQEIMQSVKERYRINNNAP